MTTGEIWQFLKLEADLLTIDSVRYYFDNLELLLGVLDAIAADVGKVPDKKLGIG